MSKVQKPMLGLVDANGEIRMATEWFWKVQDNVSGPFRSRELIRLGRQGKIPKQALVRRGRGGKWNPARSIAGLFETQPEESMWYVVRNGQMRPIGPLTARQLKKLAENGGIPRDAFIRNGLQSRWVHVTKVQGLAEYVVNTPHSVAASMASQANPIPLAPPSTFQQQSFPTFYLNPVRKWWHGIVPVLLVIAAGATWSFWPEETGPSDPVAQERLARFRVEEKKLNARTGKTGTERRNLIVTIARHQAIQEDEAQRRKHQEASTPDGVLPLPYDSQFEVLYKKFLAEAINQHSNTDIEALRALAAYHAPRVGAATVSK